MSKSSKLPSYKFETLAVTFPSEYVARVELNRPTKLNAMNRLFWSECRECFEQLSHDSRVRCVVITAAGRVFTAGLDLIDMGGALTSDSPDENKKESESKKDAARMAYRTYKEITELQESFTKIENCNKPVIAAIHNGCVGGGVDLIAACDIRICAEDAWFTIKEVDIGLAADVGSLQRLPKIIGNHSLLRELAYTARKMDASEAMKLGLVSKVCKDRDETIRSALEMAKVIASKSPVAVWGTKMNLNYARDHSTADGLNYVATWNAGMLQTNDIAVAVQASFAKQSSPVFAKL